MSRFLSSAINCFRIRLAGHFWIASLLFVLFSSSLEAQPTDGGDDFFGRRYALVIGNGAYVSAPLANPENDARDVAGALKKIGFRVTLVLNADLAGLRLALAEFESALPEGAAVVVFYAGHGVQYRSQNFILPIGSTENITDGAGLIKSAVGLNDILNQFGGRKNAISVIILDACRDSPFKNVEGIEPGLSRSVNLGGASARASKKKSRAKAGGLDGVVVAYSTAPDMVAEDGTEKNSPYTKHLKRFLLHPDISLETVLKRTRIEVTKETAGRQTPWYEASVSGDFFPGGRGRMEFEDLLQVLSPDRDPSSETERSDPSWELVLNDVAAPVRWEHAELTDVGDRDRLFDFQHNVIDMPLMRRGKVVVTMDGKLTHGPLVGKQTPAWIVTLYGSMARVEFVSLSSDVLGGALPAGKLLGEVDGCRQPGPGGGSTVFEVKFPGRGPAWLAENPSCGVRDCSYDYVMFFDEGTKKRFGCAK